MKYKNGSPQQMYVLTFQDDGSMVAYTNLRVARDAKRSVEHNGFDVVLATYVLKGA